jgi:hypothetical protein
MAVGEEVALFVGMAGFSPDASGANPPLSLASAP